MKKITIISTVLIAIAITVNAQTAADYYFPLCVGNYVKFHTPGKKKVASESNWSARTTVYSIVQSDIINDEVYYLQKGYDFGDANPADTSVFQCFWVRKDVDGNIIMGAYDETSSGILDSATFLETPYLLFPNQKLTLGYSQFYDMGGGMTVTDSVISVSATVGVYTNCIQVRSIRKDNGIIDMLEDTYYAYHLGYVKIERLYPDEDIHVDNLVDFVAESCNSTGISDDSRTLNEFSFYPNPACDILNVNFENRDNSELTFNIYNVIGKLVSSEALEQNQQKINISDLNNGIYIVEIKSGVSLVKHKLIIQR